jgi:hypothetical protein
MFSLAVSEALLWLEARGLFVADPKDRGGYGWRVLSRRAERFASKTEFQRFEVARRLPKDALHSALRNKVWAAFMRGEFDVAVLQAMKASRLRFERRLAGHPPKSARFDAQCLSCGCRRTHR